MIYDEAEGGLANFFLTVVTAERQTDVYRSLLIEQPDFDAFACFQELDSTRCGFLSGVDFEHYLHTRGDPVNEAEARVLAAVFDWDGDRRVSFGDFVNKLGVARWRKDAQGRFDAGHALTRLLHRELESVRRVSSALLELHIEFGWQFLYNSLVSPLHTHVSGESLLEFLRTHGIPTDLEGIKAIFRVFDRDRDGQISYVDFMMTVKLMYKGVAARNNAIIERDLEEVGSDYRYTASLSYHSPKDKKFMSGSYRTSLHSSPRRCSTRRHNTTRSPRLASPSTTSQPSVSPFISFLDVQVTVIRKVEREKKELAKAPGFHPRKCFESLLPTQGKFLTASNLQNTLSRAGVKVPSIGLRRLMLTFNNSSDAKLKFSEFSEMIGSDDLPASLPASPSSSPSVFGLFQSLIWAEETIDSARRSLASTPEFKCSSAFSVLDAENKGSVTRDDFVGVLRRWKLISSEEEAFALFRRYDKNRDGRITYAEFVQEVAAFEEPKGIRSPINTSLD